MAWRLINHRVCPPGEFIYEQTEGVRRKFPAGPDIEALARVVAEFRQANKVPRGTFAAALEDIDAYTCQRIGNHRDWCYNTDRSYAETTPAARPQGGCGGCGARMA